jgi:alkanesulfonate monooxygenase SsuD/methylene tetrahydromethanopterin reductase-like flavin-dependent oxidoreductase (luciferase family)
VKLGVLVESEEGLDWAHWRRTFEAVERLGFDSLWLSDHLESPWNHDRHGLDPFIALGVAAAETHRIRLGTLVSPITFREPIILARMAEAIAALAPGRFVLGLGLGWNREEHARHGLMLPPLRERERRLRDTLERVTNVPVLLGGTGATILRLAAARAHAWNVTTASPERFVEVSARLLSERRIERSIAAGVLIWRDDAERLRRSARIQERVPPLGEVPLEHVPDAARKREWLVGTPREIAGQLEALEAVGVELAILGHYDLEDVSALELIARDVMR